MASSRRQPEGVRSWFSWAGLVMVMAVSPAAADQEPSQAVVAHLRPTTRQAAEYLEAGTARSATFRQLVATIDHSDLAVYVQALPVGNAGQLHLVTAAGGLRYLWITVRIQGTDEVLPYLAHELAHAVEIAQAPEVKDAASLLRLYERLGRSSKGIVSARVETVNAQRIQGVVAGELRR